MTPRTDLRTSSLICLALYYRIWLGHVEAAKLLARHCVPLPIARRVLTTYRRRNAPPLCSEPPAFE